MKKFLKGIAMIILVTILFVSSMVLLLIAPIRKTISEKTIKDIISSLEIEKEVENNPVFKEELDKTLEPIYDVTREIGIEDEVVVKILDTDVVKDLIGDVSSNVVDSLLTGENKKLFTSNDIESVLNKGIDEVNKTGLYEINEDAREEILEIANEAVEDFQEFIPNTNVVLDEVNEEDMALIENVRFVLSNKFLIYVLGVFLGAFLGILLLNFKHYKWIKVSLITILLASIMSLLINSIILLMNNVVIKEDYVYLFSIVGKFINKSYIISGSTFISTIVLLIIWRIFKIKKKIS